MARRAVPFVMLIRPGFRSEGRVLVSVNNGVTITWIPAFYADHGARLITAGFTAVTLG